MDGTVDGRGDEGEPRGEHGKEGEEEEGEGEGGGEGGQEDGGAAVSVPPGDGSDDEPLPPSGGEEQQSWTAVETVEGTLEAVQETPHLEPDGAAVGNGEAPVEAATAVTVQAREAGADGAAAAEESLVESPPPPPPPAGTATDGEGAGVSVIVSGAAPEEGDMVRVVEWRTQEEVDEWFALQLAGEMEAVAADAQQQQQEQERGEEEKGGVVEGRGEIWGGAAAGALGEGAGQAVPAAATATAVVAPTMHALELPVTIQEAFGAEIVRVRGELSAKLEEARAELSRNTEAYKQYRARVRGYANGLCVILVVSG